jgi:hypothetical protein
MDTTWELLLLWGLRSQPIKAGGTQMVKSKKSNFRKNRNPKGFGPNGAKQLIRDWLKPSGLIGNCLHPPLVSNVDPPISTAITGLV